MFSGLPAICIYAQMICAFSIVAYNTATMYPNFKHDALASNVESLRILCYSKNSHCDDHKKAKENWNMTKESLDSLSYFYSVGGCKGEPCPDVAYDKIARFHPTRIIACLLAAAGVLMISPGLFLRHLIGDILPILIQTCVCALAIAMFLFTVLTGHAIMELVVYIVFIVSALVTTIVPVLQRMGK